MGDVQYGDKISLFSDEIMGYVSMQDLSSNDLSICSLPSASFAPANFEKCVFTMTHPDSWSTNCAKPYANDNDSHKHTFDNTSSRYIMYGNVVQLQHSVTGMMLATRKRAQAETEKSAYKVSLCKRESTEDPRDCNFKIMPRYKIRHQGERVRYQDQIVLVSEGDERYLHASLKTALPNAEAQKRIQKRGSTSGNPIPEEFHPQLFEVNVAFMATSWTVVFYDALADSHLEDDEEIPSASIIRCGHPLLLFHKEVEGFLSCEPKQHLKILEDELVKRLKCCQIHLDSSKAESIPSESPRASLNSPVIISVEGGDGESKSTNFAPTKLGIAVKPINVAIPRLTLAVEEPSAPITPSNSKIQRFVKEASKGSPHEVKKDSVYFHKVRVSNTYNVEALPFSSNSMWIVEHLDCTRGGPVRYGVQIRLRHVPTNRYLCIRKMGEPNAPSVTAKPRRNIFSFKMDVHPFREEDIAIPYVFHMSETAGGMEGVFVCEPLDAIRETITTDSFLRIQHKQSGLWLANPSSRIAVDNDTTLEVFTPRTIGSCKDNKKVFPARQPAVLSAKLYYEDVFDVAHCKDEKMQGLAFVMQAIESLKKYTIAFQMQSLEYGKAEMKRIVAETKAALSHLVLYCSKSDDQNPLTRQGVPIKARQELLLDQNVHQWVVEVLRSPFEPPPNSLMHLLQEHRVLQMHQARSKKIEPRKAFVINIEHVTKPVHADVHMVCRLCYRFLQQVVKGSVEFAMKLSEYIPIMQRQFGFKFGVEDTLMEIFKNNRPLLEAMNQDVLECFVRLSRSKGKVSRFLNFLCELCVCDGTGMTKNQNIICDLLFGESNHLLIPMRLGNDGIVTIQVPRMESKSTRRSSPVPFERKVEKAPDSPSKDEEEEKRASWANLRAVVKVKSALEKPKQQKDMETRIEKLVGQWISLSSVASSLNENMNNYLETQLHLLANLCVGNNVECKQKVQQIVSKAMIVAVVGPDSKHSGISEFILSKFVLLATHLYIDTGKSLSAKNFVKSWKSLRNFVDEYSFDEDLQHNLNPSDPFLASLKMRTLDYLHENTVQYADSPGRNQLTFNILELWIFCCEYRQYSTNEISRLLQLVLKLLDCTSDRQSSVAPKVMIGREGEMKKEDWDRFGVTENNLIIVKCKKSVCKLISILLDHNTYSTITVFLSVFHQKRDTVSTSQFVKVMEVLCQLRSLNSEKTLASLFHDQEYSEECRLLQESNFNLGRNYMQRLMKTDTLAPILLHLTSFKTPELVTDALAILFRVFSFRSEVSNSVNEVELLFDQKSEEVYEHAVDMASRFRSIIRDSPNLDAVDDIENIIRYFAQSLDLETKPSDSVQYDGFEEFEEDSTNRLQPQQSSASVIQSGRRRRGSMQAGHKELVKRELQDIFRCIGLHEIICECLRWLIVHRGRELESPRRLVKARAALAQCCELLSAFVSGNERNQISLCTPHCISLLLQLVSEDVNADVTLELIYENNIKLSVTVDERVVNVFTGMLSNTSTPPEKSIRWLRFLKGLTVTNGFPITRNQSLVMNACVEMQSLDFIQSITATNTPHELALAAAFVDLLASCCVGFISSTEAPAQTILPLTCVLNTLGGAHLPERVQLPYLRFLWEVYWDSEEGLQGKPQTHSPVVSSDMEHDMDAGGMNQEDNVWWMCNSQWWMAVSTFHTTFLRFIALCKALGKSVESVSSESGDELPELGYRNSGNLDYSDGTIDVAHLSLIPKQDADSDSDKVEDDSEVAEFQELQDQEITEDYFQELTDFIFSGVIPALTSFVSKYWSAEVAASMVDGVQVDLLANLASTGATFIDIIDPAEIDVHSFEMLGNFYEALLRAQPSWNRNVKDAQYPIPVKQWSDKCQRIVESVKRQTIHRGLLQDTVAQKIQSELRTIQKEFGERDSPNSLDDVQAFTAVMESILNDSVIGDPLIQNLVYHMRDGSLRTHVKVGVLKLLTQMIENCNTGGTDPSVASKADEKGERRNLGGAAWHASVVTGAKAEEPTQGRNSHISLGAAAASAAVWSVQKRKTNTYTLAEIQKRMNALGVSPLMTMLVEGEEDEVQYAAVDFGVQLLWGGNKVVQDSLLRYFKANDELFFIAMVEFLRESIRALKQRKRYQAFLQQHGHTEDELETYRQELDRQPDLCGVKQKLRLLQLFCEGHHFELQNYIRQQADNLHSFNLVNEVVAFLKEVVTNDLTSDKILIDIAQQTFNTLTEFCQGPCQANQSTLVSCNVCNEANIVLSANFDDADEDEVMNLQSSAVQTLLSLLEGCNDVKLPNLMLHSISVDSLFRTLERVWVRVKSGIDKESLELSDEMDTLMDLAYKLFILVHQLQTWNDGDWQLANALSQFSGVKYFYDMLGVIEIARENTVEKVYFRKPAICNALNQEYKDELLAKVDRSSPASKVSDFFERACELIYKMEFQRCAKNFMNGAIPPTLFSTSRKGLVSRLLGKIQNQYASLRRMFIDKVPGSGVSIFENGSLIVAMVQNILVIMYFMHPELMDDDTCTEFESPDIAGIFFSKHSLVLRLALAVLGVIQMAMSVAIWLTILYLQVPLLAASDGKMELATKGADKMEFAVNIRSSVKQFLKLFPRLEPNTKILYCYYFSLIVFSALGLTVSPFFFSVHLLSVINKSSIIQNVMRSVTLNGRSLLLTAFLGLVIIYLFSVVGYLMFPDDFIADGGDRHCNSLAQCFVFSLAHGIRSGGGLGELLEEHSWRDRGKLPRMLFDFLFYVLVNVILLNIIFGIIIDTFAELRDEKCKVEEDTKKRCFICGIDAYSFDRNVEGGFEKHVKTSHNMWQYLYFMHHLKRKQTDEFTGQESYVWDKMQLKDTSFFPLNKALDLVHTTKSAHIGVAQDDASECGSPPVQSQFQASQSHGSQLNLPSFGKGQPSQGGVGAITKRVERLETMIAQVSSQLTDLHRHIRGAATDSEIYASEQCPPTPLTEHALKSKDHDELFHSTSHI